MITEECEAYWDNHSVIHVDEDGRVSIRDNYWKRQQITKRLLDLDLIDKVILEIGVGAGTAFAAIRLVLLDVMKYRCTDISLRYVDFVKNQWHASSVQADVTNLPGEDNTYDYIIALDSLEHVDPVDRLSGYKEIDRVLKPKGRVVMNIPKSKGCHEAFDWPLDDKDLLVLMHTCNLQVEKHERWSVQIKGKTYNYEWFIGFRDIHSDSDD